MEPSSPAATVAPAPSALAHGSNLVGPARAAAEPALRARVRIWDLPTRLFHWALATTVIVCFVTAKIGGNAMQWHMWSGYAALSLVLFRLLWGFAGDRYARFASFAPSVRATLAYLRADARSAGHSPLGAWSVYLLLAAVFLQAGTGLFANDAIFTEGPLAKLVSSASSDLATRIHHLNEWTLWVLVGLHLAAIGWYRIARRDDLITPMIVGDKRDLAAHPATDDARLRLRAVIFLALAGGLVGYVVSL